MSGLMQFLREQSKPLRKALFVMAFLSGVAFGQVESGQITGRVVDPNGAVIGGTVVQVKSVDTGVERTATTTDEGFYIVTNLPPAIYEVSIQAQGFAVRTQRVRVFVGSSVRLDAQLSVTPVTAEEEIVEGSGGVAINTQTGQLSDPISGRQLRELPVITRDPYSLVTLSGNVTPFRINPLGGFPTLGFSGVSINTAPDQDFAIDGQPPTFNNVLIDGGENIVNYWSTLGQRIPLDGVQEINVITNGFRPEFGRFGGGLINVASRSGTNNWRGTLFEYYRGSAFNGGSFEGNALGIGNTHLVGNNFGFAVGGPIKKDRLFFFNSTEGIIVRSREDRLALVPTPDLLTALATPTTPAVPATAPLTPAFFAPFTLPTINGQTFTGSQILSQLGPVSSTSPFLLFATANPTLPILGQTIFNVQTEVGGGLPQDTVLTVGRLDYTLSDSSVVYGRYAFADRDIYRGALSFSPFPGFNTGVRDKAHNAVINWLKTLSGPGCCSGPGASAWLMNLKAFYNRINLTRNNDTFTVGPRLVSTGFPLANVAGFPLAFPGDFPFDPTLNSLITGPLNLFQASADFAGTWRGHQIQFGGSYYYFQDNRNILSFQDGLFTLGTDVPTALDNLISGTASAFSVAINPLGLSPGATIPLPAVAPDFNRSISEHDFSLYGSFNWRIKPNFNVLLGLRYDFFGRPRSRNDQIFFNFFPGPGTDPAIQVANGVLAAPGTVVDLDGDGVLDNTNSFFSADTNNVAPRIGFAWDITGGRGGSCCGGGGLRRSTTLRGSFGLTYERLFYAVSPFFQTRSDFGIPSLVAGTFLPDGVTPIGPIPLSTSNFGPLGGTGTAVLPNFLVRGVERGLDAPRIMFWTVALDREIFRNTIASLQYAGAHGRDLFTLANVNRPGSAAAFLTPTTPPVATTARLNPTLGPIFFLQSNGRSNYNAFIADLSNSTWRTLGLQFTARYRWSHALDNVSSFFGNNFGVFGGSFTPNLLSPFDPNNDYGSSDFDVRHRFIGSLNWEVPFGDFSSCCGGTNRGWKNWLLSGWQLTGIFAFQTGLPFTVFDCAGALTPETPCPRAVAASGVNLGSVRDGQGSSVPDTFAPNRFNFIGEDNFGVIPTTTVFPPFSAGTVGRNFFRGPNFWNIDAGLYKRFRITENTNIQLRGEFYNLFNHANLFVPHAVDISSNSFVPAFKFGRRVIQVGARFNF